MKLSHRHESDSQLNETLKNEDHEATSSDTEHYPELATQSDDEQFVRVVSLQFALSLIFVICPHNFAFFFPEQRIRAHQLAAQIM